MTILLGIDPATASGAAPLGGPHGPRAWTIRGARERSRTVHHVVHHIAEDPKDVWVGMETWGGGGRQDIRVYAEVAGDWLGCLIRAGVPEEQILRCTTAEVYSEVFGDNQPPKPRQRKKQGETKAAFERRARAELRAWVESWGLAYDPEEDTSDAKLRVVTHLMRQRYGLPVRDGDQAMALGIVTWLKAELQRRSR